MTRESAVAPQILFQLPGPIIMRCFEARRRSGSTRAQPRLPGDEASIVVLADFQRHEILRKGLEQVKTRSACGGEVADLRSKRTFCIVHALHELGDDEV